MLHGADELQAFAHARPSHETVAIVTLPLALTAEFLDGNGLHFSSPPRIVDASDQAA